MDFGYGKCTAEGCGDFAKYKATRLCGKHYQRMRVHGTLEERPKRGRTAGELAEYSQRRKRNPMTCGHPNRRHYAKGMCASCYTKDWQSKHPGHYVRDWELRNPEKFATLKRRILLRKHGITLEDYETMWHLQGGQCANLRCGAQFPLVVSDYRFALQVDHCHRTLKVRALLCPSCNRALGHVDDNADRLAGLIDYLAKHGPELALGGLAG